MRERRWESRSAIRFEEVIACGESLRRMGLKPKSIDQEGACYFEEFWVKALDELDRLQAWPIDEVTLVQVLDRWDGDFFVLAGRHHEVYRRHQAMEAYLSVSHPWRMPQTAEPILHQDEAMCWIGFRNTHGFIRVRVVPGEIITPLERRDEGRRAQWMAERDAAFSVAIDALGLPLFVDWSNGAPSVASTDAGCRVSGSWPDAFGPCQFEYVVPNRYELLVPIARLVEQYGTHPAMVRTFLSGVPRSGYEAFHRIQPAAGLLYRGYVQAELNDLPNIVSAIAPRGRALVTFCEFRTGRILRVDDEAYAVVGVIGTSSGYRMEIRLNRAPLPEDEMEEWLNRLLGMPMAYAPLALY